MADNGSEFAFLYQLADTLGIPTYFADPYSAWQRGTKFESGDGVSHRVELLVPGSTVTCGTGAVKLKANTTTDSHIELRVVTPGMLSVMGPSSINATADAGCLKATGGGASCRCNRLLSGGDRSIPELRPPRVSRRSGGLRLATGSGRDRRSDSGRSGDVGRSCVDPMAASSPAAAADRARGCCLDVRVLGLGYPLSVTSNPPSPERDPRDISPWWRAIK